MPKTPKRSKKNTPPEPVDASAATEPSELNDQETTEQDLTPVDPVESDASSTKPATPTPTNTSSSSPTPKVVRQDQKPKASAKKRWPLWVWYVIGLVVLAGASVAGYLVFTSPEAVTNTNTPVNRNTNTAAETAPRLVDGVLVSPSKTNPNLTAVMIENSSDARPPSALDKASVVYEALAEGGITRFMAIFTSDAAETEVGPVRSARPYFVDWASEYNKPLYVHAGGSPQALDLLRSSKTTVVDFNQFTNGPYFYRDKTRRRPHDLYITADKLLLAVRDKVADGQPSFTSWAYANEPGIDARPETVNDIIVKYSSLSYQTTYSYDRGLNVYRRSLGGQPHLTRAGTPITAKNVVVQFVRTGLYPKETQRLKMETVGEGKAYIFRNGQSIIGTWKKDAATNRTMFYDEAGQPVVFARGNTWISVVPTDRTVTY